MDRDHLFNRAKTALEECGQVLDCLNALPSNRVTEHKHTFGVVSRLAERIALASRMALETYGEGGLAAGRGAEQILLKHIELAERCIHPLKRRLEQGAFYA